MKAERVHRISHWAVLALSLIALLTVLTGYLQTPQHDEGAGAHIFQLTIVLLGPALLVFLATADWSDADRALRTLVPSLIAVFLAFAFLYYLEHVWYARAALRNLR